MNEKIKVSKEKATKGRNVGREKKSERPKKIKPEQQSVKSSDERVLKNQMLSHFDEINGIAISSSDISATSSNVPLSEAYSHRYNKLKAQLTSSLSPKIEHLKQLRRQLQNTSDEAAVSKAAIEKETQLDTQQILQRLNIVESMKQSAIQQEILRLDEEIGVIDRLERQVNIAEAVNDNNSSSDQRLSHTTAMVELIQQFSHLSAKINTLSTNSITVQLDHPIDDIPRETTERLQILSRCDQYIHAVNVKDQMLWTAMQEKQTLEELLSAERALSQEYAVEVAGWADLTQNMKRQIGTAQQEKELAEQKSRELLMLLKKHNIYH